MQVGTSYSDVISPQDVALYGSLCALATFDRSELKSRIMDNIRFREFLEMVPEVGRAQGITEKLLILSYRFIF